MCAATLSRDAAEPTFDDLLASGIPHLLPNHPHVVSILPISAPGGRHLNVRRVLLSTGESVIAKRHLFASITEGRPYHLLSVEKTVTDLLVRNKCAVPKLLGVIEKIGVVILENVGVRTLDDFVQTHSPIERARLAVSAIDAWDRIEDTLIGQKKLKEEILAPGGDRDSVRDSFTSVRDVINAEGIRSLIGPRCSADEIIDGIHRLISQLADRSMHLGPTDYNARNIVISESGSPFFLEWSKLGYDWPERRIVQYLTSLGAGRKGSRPRSLIDTWIVDRYADRASWADPESSAFALDAHHLIFHLLLALRSTQRGDPVPGGIRSALVVPLSRSPEMKELRSLFLAKS